MVAQKGQRPVQWVHRFREERSHLRIIKLLVNGRVALEGVYVISREHAHASIFYIEQKEHYTMQLKVYNLWF